MGIELCSRLQAKLEPYLITWVTVRALNVSPVRSTYGGYYGLGRRYAAVSASAFHRLRDNLK